MLELRYRSDPPRSIKGGYPPPFVGKENEKNIIIKYHFS